MRRLGAGAVWRGNSRHPFLAPSGTAAERVDLSHLTGPDLRTALERALGVALGTMADAPRRSSEKLHKAAAAATGAAGRNSRRFTRLPPRSNYFTSFHTPCA